MAFRIQSSFSAGELDPALWERTTLDKYNSGLAALRNAYVGKTGRVITRQGTSLKIATKYANKKSRIYSPLYSDFTIEWGDQYVRIHNVVAGTYVEQAHDWLESDLDTIQFFYSGKFVYILCFGKIMKKMVLGDLDASNPLLANRFVDPTLVFALPVPPINTPIATGGTGSDVEYFVSYVLRNEESLGLSIPVASGGNWKLPINAGEVNAVTFKTPSIFGAAATDIKEGRVYRRPKDGGAYGYVGSTTYMNVAPGAPPGYSGEVAFVFKDFGQAADYTHSPPDPSFIAKEGVGTPNFPEMRSRTGCIYQQRLVLSEQINEEGIHASRPAFQNNFYTDHPLNSESALNFKSGTSGSAKVLRLMDVGSLAAFTTVGIYLSPGGALSPTNIAMDKKAPYVIDETVAPLELPGALLFVEKATNAIIAVNYSTENASFIGEEISIYSNHLFANKRIKSWCYQDGIVPLVWAVYDDGTLATLTFQKEQKMIAWARHDSDGIFESVTVQKSLTGVSTVYFVVLRGSARYIEKLAPRYVANFKDYIGMDATVTYRGSIAATFTVNPIVAGDWTSVDLAASAAVFANTAGNGAVGTIFRFFDSDGARMDLQVTAYVSTTHVTVTPLMTLPHDPNQIKELFKPTNVVTGLSHLEGKKVSVRVDGYTYGSPNNTTDDYGTYTVTGGQITLESGRLGAVIQVGLPYTWDVGTLDIDTVEQKPTMLESRLCNRVYVAVFKSRGFYVGPYFPDNNSIDGMANSEDMIVPIGNSSISPYTKKLEIDIQGDWESNGRICLRGVDPDPVEVLSITPDLEIYRRRS